MSSLILNHITAAVCRTSGANLAPFSLLTARTVEESAKSNRFTPPRTGLVSVEINPIRHFREWFLAHTHAAR